MTQWKSLMLVCLLMPQSLVPPLGCFFLKVTKALMVAICPPRVAAMVRKEGMAQIAPLMLCVLIMSIILLSHQTAWQ